MAIRRSPGSEIGWLGLVLAFAGCAHRVLTPEIHTPDAPPQSRTSSPVLKVHMKSGELYTLTNWRAAPDGSRVEGTGTRYSLARVAAETRSFSIPTDDVALFETNTSENVRPGGAIVLAVWSTLTGALAAYCLADPKACFGSCPTFYREDTDPDGRRPPRVFGLDRPGARGARRGRDRRGPAAGGRFALTMRNEAFETHALRRVRLLAAERPPEGRVLAGPGGRFYPATEPRAPLSCRAAEGDCLPAVLTADATERASLADAKDLATREIVELDFAPVTGRVGLALAGRQTLLSTHLFYQTMAYLGAHAGEYLASLERGGPAVAARAMGMARVLGGIDLEVSESGGPFRPIGSFDEAGPIAGDVRVLPFEAHGGPLRVRLRQAKGHWRLDHVALVRLGEPVVPLALGPSAVERGSRADARALELLRRGERHLVTLPGDAYRIVFELPASPRGFELFLESEGYYYEWMRREWLAEENPEMASLVLSDPALALRRMAGPFKQREDGMERAFWASRFRK
jgi:hypothetical protein